MLQSAPEEDDEILDIVQKEDRLLTYRGPRGTDAKEQQFMRSIRKPDFLRTSL